MATANQNSSQLPKPPLFQRYAGSMQKDSPHSVTPQNFKIGHIQTTKAEAPTLLDTAKTSTKSQGTAHLRQILTLQNSQIHGRKVDSPKIYINKELEDSLPKTSAQCNRKINKKSKKAPQIPIPSNNNSSVVDKQRGQKKKHSNITAQSNTSGSCLTIFPAHPTSSRKVHNRFDFGLNHQDEEAGVNANTERVDKRIAKVIQEGEKSNNSVTQSCMLQSGYQKIRQQRPKSVNPAKSRRSVVQNSLQINGAPKPPPLLSPQTANSAHFNKTQSVVTQQDASTTKQLKSQRPHKFNQTQLIMTGGDKRDERHTRSSEQKSRPSIAATQQKRVGPLKKSSKKPSVHVPHPTSKSQHGNLRYRKNSSIESQSKLAGPGTACDHAFSYDLDADAGNKENYPSNSSLHAGKSKPLSEQSKSVSAGRARPRGSKIRNDLSLSSLSSHNHKVEASGGSQSKMTKKPFFIGGDKILKALSPPPNRTTQDMKKKDIKDLLSVSRTSSPAKGQVKRAQGAKSGDVRPSRHQPQLSSIEVNNSKLPKSITKSAERVQQVGPKKQTTQLALEQFKKQMEELQKKTDKEVQKRTQVDSQLQEPRAKSKKQRSKSCNSKTDQITFEMKPEITNVKEIKEKPARERSKESVEQLSSSIKRVKGSAIEEINQLQKAINNEIRQEKGLSVVTPSNGAKKFSTCQVTKGLDQRKPSNLSNGKLGQQKGKEGKAEENSAQKEALQKREMNKAKIQKYIEKQKRQQQQRDQIKKTIEHEKAVKIKEQLYKLQQDFPKKHRKMSKNRDKLTFTSQGGESTPVQKLNIKGSLPSRSEPLNINSVDIQKPQRSLKAQIQKPMVKKKQQFKPVRRNNFMVDTKDKKEFSSGSNSAQERDTPPQREKGYDISDMFSHPISSSKSHSKGKTQDQLPDLINDSIDLKPIRPLLQDGGKQQQNKPKKPITLTNLDPMQAQISDQFESIDPTHQSKKDPSIFSSDDTKQKKSQGSNIYDVSEIAKKRKKTPSPLEHLDSQDTFDKPQDKRPKLDAIQTPVPPIDLTKISSQPLNESKKKKPTLLDLPHHTNTDADEKKIESQRSSNISIFERTSFQEMFKKGDLLPNGTEAQNIPELLKIREEAVRKREQNERNKYQQQLNANQITPRTYQKKQRDLEMWVTVQTEKLQNLRDQHGLDGKDSKASKGALGVWEVQKSKDLMNQMGQDNEQLHQVLGLHTGRSSQKSKPPFKQADEYPVSSEHHTERPKSNWLDLINEQKGKDGSSNSNKQNLNNKLNSKQSSYSETSSHFANPESDSGDNKLDIEQVDIQPQINLEPPADINQKSSQSLIHAPSHNKLPELYQESPKLSEESDQSQKLLVKNQGMSSLHDGQLTEQDEFTKKVTDSLTNEIGNIRTENYFTKEQKEIFGNQSKGPIRIETQGGDEPTPNNNIVGQFSPYSGTSSNCGIEKGGLSLESSTSGENKEQLKEVLAEIRNEGTRVLEQLQPPIQHPDETPVPSAVQEEQFKTTLGTEMQQYAEALTDEIFGGLMTELLHKYNFELLLNRDSERAFQLHQQQQQEQMQIQQQLKGIKTDIFQIERYVDEIVEQIKQNSAQFLSQLNKPLTKEHLDLLKQLHDTEVGSCEHFEEHYPMVLPLDLYLTLEKRRKEKREKENAEAQTGNQQLEQCKVLVAECEHIHNKVLFDCINDSLLQFKPYGKEGQPLPWQRKNRRLKPADDFSVDEIFEIVKHDLFRWAITGAGTLPRQEFVFRGIFDEELFSEIREKKLVALLGREMIETEPRWLNYEFEQAQVKIDLSDNILEILVTECINQLKQNEEAAQEDLDDHPLMRQLSDEREFEQPGSNQRREFELYEQHILSNIGVASGNKERALAQDKDNSGYNSKDSDFSNNLDSQPDDDFGGNQSRSSSNLHYHDEDF